MSSENVIEVEDLEHSYGKNKALKGINFSVERGKTFGLLGRNGAGKTTTINILMGFLKPSAGSCSVLGERPHALSANLKRRVGLLHEGHLSYEFMSIRQTEKFYRAFYPAWDSRAFTGLMNKLGLKENHKIKHMSCGQRSQVALAVLIAQNADVLILDDFSMGLDAGYRRLFLDSLNSYVKERDKTVLVTTHIIQDLERFVDNALIIDKGSVLKSAPLSELKKGLFGYRFNSENIERLAGLPEVKDLSATNTGYEAVLTLPPKEAAEYLSAKLEERVKAEYFDITLEDAFIALTGK